MWNLKFEKLKFEKSNNQTSSFNIQFLASNFKIHIIVSRMLQTVYKSGSSFVVVIPSGFVEMVGVKSGDPVRVSIDYERGEIRYRFSGIKQMVLIKQNRKT